MRRRQRPPAPPLPAQRSATATSGWPGPVPVEPGSSQLEAVRAGNAETFADLFSEHARAVFSVCGRRSGDWDAAEDLTSIVFLEAWRTRGRAFASADGSLLPWLLGIARNVTAMSRRSLRRYDAAISRFAGQVPASTSAGDAVEDEAIRAGDQARLQGMITSAVQALPRDQRVVAELCLLAGRSPDEVAVVLGVPVSTVTSRLADGRRGLRRLLRSSDVDQPSWLIGNTHVSAAPAPPMARKVM